MKTLSNNDPVTTTKGANTQTFSATLKDGREVTIRGMTGRDLVFMEKELGKLTEFEKAMKVIEHLQVGDSKITFEDILDLGVSDYRKLNGLVEQANADEEDSPK
jgi:hypothetical protein